MRVKIVRKETKHSIVWVIPMNHLIEKKFSIPKFSKLLWGGHNFSGFFIDKKTNKAISPPYKNTDSMIVKNWWIHQEWCEVCSDFIPDFDNL